MTDDLTWTPAEIREFDRLTQAASTYGIDHAMKRPIARNELKQFIAKHGQAKCDAMFSHLMQQDAK